MRLPPELAVLVDEVIDRARLDDAEEREVRADLEQHLRDGLARGRSAQELRESFGDPAAVAPLLSRTPAPVRTVRSRTRGDGPLRTVWLDVSQGVRSLVRTPSLSLTAILVLALGIGANTVVFTVANELVLRPIAVENPDGLVDVWADIPGANSFTGLSYQDFVTFREENRVLVELAAFSGRRLEMGSEPGSRPVVAQFVSPEYFPMLGLRGSQGRMAFAPDARFGDPPEAVLSHGFWIDALGGDPNVVGSSIVLSGHVVTVVGVGPRDFSGHFIGFPTDLWVPIASLDPLTGSFDPDDRSQKDLEMMGRLREGVSEAAAHEALNAIAADIEAAHPEVNRGHRVGVTMTTGLDHSLRDPVRAFVGILTVVSTLVLLIACLNVGSVLLVRTMARERELAVRVALGAGRVRLLRGLAVESGVLVLAGLLVGLAVALRLNRFLSDTLAVLAAGVGLELSLDQRVVAMAITAAVVAAGLSTAAPAIHMLRKNPAGVLRARSSGRETVRLRSVLVIAQVAVSVILVITTGLFARALVSGQRLDPGFDADRTASFILDLPDTDADARAAETEILAALRTVPGIEAAVSASAAPIGVGRNPVAVDIPGVEAPMGLDRLFLDARVVDAGYLETLGIALRAGRGIERRDTQGGAPVAVVSETFATRFWPGLDPIGRSIAVEDVAVQVVGIAADTRFVVQDDDPDALLYLSRTGDLTALPVITFRAANIGRMSAEVNRIVGTIAPGHRRVQPRSGREVLDDALLPQRSGVVLVGGMGLAALFLAAVGLYGLIQFTVARDTHELGVRLALGGGSRDLLTTVMNKGFRLVAVGVLIGVGVSLLVTPVLRPFLGDVSPADPITYLSVLACFAAIAAVASGLPARRAMRIEAVEALRHT